MKASFALIVCLLFAGLAPAADNAPGETTQVLARTLIVAVKAALTTVDKQKADDPRGKLVMECIQAVEPAQIEGVTQEALVRIMGDDDLKVADQFFARQSGRNFMLNAEAVAHQKLGTTPREPPPKLTPADEQEITEFFSTPAGKKFYTAMSSMEELREPLTQRILELGKACVLERKKS